MNLRAVLFDVNGTLIDIETDEHMEQIYRAISRFLSYQGIALKRWELHDLYFQVMKEQFEASLEPFPEFDAVGVWREILLRHANAQTRALPLEKWLQLPRFLAELQRGISRKRLSLFPQVLEGLDSVRGRFRLAVVSDAQTAYALPELRLVGLEGYFDSIVISGDYGYRKPDERLFKIALDQLRVRPEQAVFVGNDPYRDVYGARQAGMKTILFCPGGRADNSSKGAEPDYILYRYSDLPAALDFFDNGGSALS